VCITYALQDFSSFPHDIHVFELPYIVQSCTKPAKIAEVSKNQFGSELESIW